MRKLTFGTGQYYHIYNRGVDKRNIFLDDKDYQRFLLSVHTSKFSTKTGEQIVNIHAYTCMPNHFHFLIEQAQDQGIAKFMQRVGTVYTRAFNRKYDRTGSLFETTYKAKHVDDDAYLSTVATYIHRNPLDLRDFQTIKRLDDYPWSSYPHYRGLTQDHLVDDEILWEYFGGVNRVKDFHQRESSNLHLEFEE